MYAIAPLVLDLAAIIISVVSPNEVPSFIFLVRALEPSAVNISGLVQLEIAHSEKKNNCHLFRNICFIGAVTA